MGAEARRGREPDRAPPASPASLRTERRGEARRGEESAELANDLRVPHTIELSSNCIVLARVRF